MYIGAGVTSVWGNSRFPLGPLSNNGIIINSLPRLECVSNSSLSGQELGTITTPDGVILHPGEQHGDFLRLHNPFRIPGALRFEPIDLHHMNLPLSSSDQGIYTCSIPDSNGRIYSFNVGFYTMDFNGE